MTKPAPAPIPSLVEATELLREVNGPLWHDRRPGAGWLDRVAEYLARPGIPTAADWDSAAQVQIDDGISLMRSVSAESVAALRSDLVEAMTPELGPRMARIAVFGDPGLSPEDAATYARATGPSAETIAAIKHAAKVMAEHGGGTPDYYQVPVEQSFECEATVEITPEGERFFRKAEPPTPFVCVSVADVSEVFSRSKGVPVAFVTDVPALRVALGSVVEMEALLRELAPAANHLAFGMDAAGNKSAALIHDSVYRARALLARIDAARKEGT